MSTLTPWRARLAPRLAPWSSFDTLQDRIDRIFGRAGPDFLPEDPMAWVPAIDLEEKDEEFVMTAEFPGMSEKDVTVDIEQSTLTLKGEKKSERKEEKKNGRWYLVERAWGAFERSFTLPSSVDPARVKAKMENGVLTIHMPKRASSAARRIPIGGTVG
jgi:HSP20 family protein